jgi:hypothetical protein
VENCFHGAMREIDLRIHLVKVSKSLVMVYQRHRRGRHLLRILFFILEYDFSIINHGCREGPLKVLMFLDYHVAFESRKIKAKFRF